VLAYHSVEDGTTPLSVSSTNFKEQLAWLHAHARVIDIRELERLITEKRLPTRTTVVITFDDGYRDVLTHALPALESFRMPATLFINAGFVGKSAVFTSKSKDQSRQIVSEQEVNVLAERGVVIGNHSFSHKQFGKISETEMKEEYTQNRDWIQKHISTNTEPDMFAYPKGSYSALSRHVLKELGTTLAFVGQELSVHTCHVDSLEIPRITVWNTMSLAEFTSLFSPSYLFLKYLKQHLSIY